MLDLQGKPTMVCVCGSKMWQLNVMWDEETRAVGWYDLKQTCIVYRKKDWNFCEQAIENLVGCFGGELDTFYAELQSRINHFKENDPGEDWNSKIKRPDPRQS